MSEPETPNDTWSNVILEFRARLSFHIAQEDPPVASEDAYRDAFDDLCDQYQERDAQRLSARIRRQHAPMIDFASAIDESCRFPDPDALSHLIWRLLAKAVQAAFESEKKLSDFIKDTARLNGQVPTLNRELLTLFSYEPRVQKPLIAFFREYMECYLTMFSDFDSAPTILQIDTFDARIQHAGEFFNQCTVEWDAARKIAEVEEQRRMLSATNPSFPNGALTGPIPSHGTNAHFRFVRDLGTGTYGEVSLVMEAASKRFFAQKTVRVRDRHDVKAKDKVERQVKNEYDIMQRLVHHHIASVLFYV